MSGCEVLVERCPNVMCDGQHEASDLCPSVSANAARHCLSLQSEIELDGGEELLFTSTKLGEIFFEEDVLNVSLYIIYKVYSHQVRHTRIYPLNSSVSLRKYN